MSEDRVFFGSLGLFVLWLFVALPIMHMPAEASEFWGLGPHGWIAVWTFALTLATAALAAVAWIQIGAARDEARSNRTLVAVDRYDFDPILDAALKSLRASREAKTPPVRGDAITVLNYLEALAIGIEQDVYDERLAKLHMRHILVTTYGRYLGPEAPPIAELDPVNYIPLGNLYRKWLRG